MQNLRRYSGMWVTIMVIALAGYAGMAAAETWESGACNAYYQNGTLAGSATNGCCVDESENELATVEPCSNGANTCNHWTVNGNSYLSCS